MSKASIRIALTLVMGIALTGLAWSQSVKIGMSNGGGYLTDSQGMTLYYFTKDVSGASVCNGKCAQAWPPFYADNLTIPSTLNKSDFGTITRDDGSKQTTFQGWPLYYWQNDKAPGDMTGQGVGGVWYTVAVPSYTVMLANSGTLGNYLVDQNGMTLYWFTKDQPGMSNCEGKCIQAWPAFMPPTVVVPQGLTSSDFGVINRADGSQQLTYRGYPLYYWQNDKQRGDTTGQNVGKVWFVIDPKNFPPKS